MLSSGSALRTSSPYDLGRRRRVIMIASSSRDRRDCRGRQQQNTSRLFAIAALVSAAELYDLPTKQARSIAQRMDYRAVFPWLKS